MESTDDVNTMCRLLLREKSLKMDDYLTQLHERVTSSPQEMMPALQAFTQVMQSAAKEDFDSETVRNLVEFVIDQSYEHTEYPMFDVLCQLADRPSFPASSALRTASYIFECNDLQEHQDKKVRLAAIRTMKTLMVKGDRAFRSQGARLVNGFIKAFTGERNPDVLLENFELARLMILLLDVQKNEQLMDEMFNALCIYFPIRFTGTSESDKLLGKQLDVALREALTSSPSFGSLLGVFLIEKLQDDEDGYKDKVDLCVLLEDFLCGYPMKMAAPFIQGIFDGLRTTAMDPRHKSGIPEIAHAVGAIIRPLLAENKFVYDKVAKHNFDNIEPFLVRPEMGLLEKAIDFVRPWAEIEGEMEIADFLRYKILELLFNNMQSATLIDYGQESLELLGKWLDLVGPQAVKMMRGLHKKKTGAFERIAHDFNVLNHTHMHVLAKIERIDTGRLTSEQIASYLRTALAAETTSQQVKNSAIQLTYDLESTEQPALGEALTFLGVEFPTDLFVNHLACAAIVDKKSLTAFESLALKNFSLESSVAIITFFLQTLERKAIDTAGKNRSEVVKELIHWLINNFKLTPSSSLTTKEKNDIVKLSEIVFNLSEGTDLSSLLKRIPLDAVEQYPYLSLMAVSQITSHHLKMSISQWYDSLHLYHPRIGSSLLYASLLQGETVKDINSLDAIVLKKRALDSTPLDPLEVTKVFENDRRHTFPFDALFDFESVWFNHTRLGLKIPQTPGMDYREKFLYQVFYPMLQFVEKKEERISEFAGMFEPALQLMDSVPSFVYDKEVYYEKILNLIMKHLAKEEEMGKESSKLMYLLPSLLKHAPSNANAKSMIETILDIVLRNNDMNTTSAAMTTLVGLVENSPSALTYKLRMKLYATADRKTICSSRKVRQLAATLKLKLVKKI